MIPVECACGERSAVEEGLAGGRWPCPRCGSSVAVPGRPAAAADGGGAAVARNLVHEGHIRAIATINRVFALGFVLLFGGMFSLLLLSGGKIEADRATLLLIVMLLVGGASFAANHALARYRDGVRWAALGFPLLWAALGAVIADTTTSRVLDLVVALAWAGACLWALAHPEAARICSASYREAVERDARTSVPFWRSPFFFAPIALILLSCCGAVVIAPFGFRTR